MNKGFVSVHRNILDWEWWDDHNTTRLFIFLIIKANHTRKLWHGITINRGQVITGRNQLAKEVGLSPQQIRYCISKLKSTNEIATKATNKYTLVTICNYDKWQSLKLVQPAKEPTKPPTSNQRVTTTNNVNNVNNTSVVKKNSLSINNSDNVKLVEKLSKLYQDRTGVPYSASKKDYVVAANLIKKSGLDATLIKLDILYAHCSNKDIWFAKQGGADFTLGKLSTHWNSLVDEKGTEKKTRWNTEFRGYDDE